MDKWESGDIFGVKGGGWMGILSRLFTTPKNDCTHYGILSHRNVEGEWIVVESTGSQGVHLSRLGKRDLRMFRVEIATPSERTFAPAFALCYEGSYYDWRLGFKLFYHGIGKLITKRRKLTARDLSEGWYKRDHFFICTESATRGYWDQEINIVPPGEIPLPCNLKQAEIDGRLKEVT
jgi:hypothetical protein